MAEKIINFRQEEQFVRKYLRHLWEEADGERQSQAESSKTHQTVKRQYEPPMSLQQREPGGRRTVSSFT